MKGVVFRGDIHIAKNGLTGNAHYNCIGLLTNRNDIHNKRSKDTNEIPNFSPEHIRPHPKAPPRKDKVGPRKRKNAILTDTPEKEAIEEALRKREQKKNKSTSKQPKRSEATKPVIKTIPMRRNQGRGKLEIMINQITRNVTVSYVQSHIQTVNQEKNGFSV
ncbi:hypothetical protein ACF0H5_000411 [Mactra antiquata]